MTTYRSRIDPKSDQFDYQQWPFFSLTRLVGLYHQRMDALLKPLDIDVPRYRVLMLLMTVPSATVTALADGAVVKLSTMAKVVQRMTAQGLVETQVSREDGRSVDVSITEMGRVKIDAVRARVALLSQQAFDGLDEAELRALTDVAGRIDRNLRV